MDDRKSYVSAAEANQSLLAIRQAYQRYARELGASGVHVRFATEPCHDGSPHIEYLRGGFDYVVTERGAELERRSAKDIDEILYWLLEDLTFSIACDYEVRHRVENLDCRRLIFAKQLELLSGLQQEWGQRRQMEINEILLRHPYHDDKRGAL